MKKIAYWNDGNWCLKEEVEAIILLGGLPDEYEETELEGDDDSIEDQVARLVVMAIIN